MLARLAVSSLLLLGPALPLTAGGTRPAAPPEPMKAARSEARSSDPSEKRPDRLVRPDWGKIQGWILDAATRKPIARARVAVEVEGAFPAEGKSTDVSDAAGQFTAKAPLGKISSKFDWGRLLTMHPISLLLSPRSVTKQTRILDVTQVNVRVEAEGYRPFVGSVRATRLDAGDFSITLDDVWLAPENSELASFSPENVRWEVIESFRVEPVVAAPGEKVRISLTARLPLGRGHRYRAYLTSSAQRLIDNQIELKRERGKDSGKKAASPAEELQESVTFTREIKLPKNSVDTWTELSFLLVRNNSTVLRQRDTRTLLQVARTPEEKGPAEKIAEGFAYHRLGDTEKALREYRTAAEGGPRPGLAALLLGDLCTRIGRHREAADHYQRLVELDPRDYDLARTRRAQSLVELGRSEEALEVLAGAEQAYGKRKIPAPVYLQRARAYAALGQFEKVDECLSLAGQELQISDAILTEINLRRLEAAVRKSPAEPDLRLSFARLLEAGGRRDEAIGQIRKAVELDRSRPWAFLELGEALWAAGRREEALANLRHALALDPQNPLVLMTLADALRDQRRYAEALPLYRKVVEAQKLNLRARHNYALMLFATQNLPEARKELVEVVGQAREKGDLREDGLPLPGAGIYFGPKRRLVSGFSIPEAAAGAALLEALQDLEHHPENALLWQNIGRALLDLELPDLSTAALARSLKADSGLLETRFLLGMAYRRTGKTEAAQRELEAAVAANPLHPRARLELAQLYTDAGELDRAQAQLAAYRKHYPHERPAL